MAFLTVMTKVMKPTMIVMTVLVVEMMNSHVFLGINAYHLMSIVMANMTARIVLMKKIVPTPLHQKLRYTKAIKS